MCGVQLVSCTRREGREPGREARNGKVSEKNSTVELRKNPLYRAERTLLSIYASIYRVYLMSTPLPRWPRPGSGGPPRPAEHTAHAAYTVAAWSHHEGGHGRERHRAKRIIDLLQG